MNVIHMIIAGGGYVLAVYFLVAATVYHKRWMAALRTAATEQFTDEHDIKDRALADWTRDTKITVCSVTGTWVSMTLAQLANSPVPHRSWNVPTSVEIHPRSMDARTDTDQAKEHRV